MPPVDKGMVELRTRRIDELTWLEFRELVPERTRAVLLPVGTLEAHGVTALGTDSILATALAERIAERVNALVAPTVPYGVTRSLLSYPGSSSVTTEGFERYMWDACISLADAGFRRIGVINGHGGNTASLKELCFRLNRERRILCLVVDWWVLCADATREVYGHEGGHAGTDENAMMLALRPELVRKELYRTDLSAQAQPGLVTAPFPGSIILYERGEGEPDFDPDRARRLFELVVDRTAAAIEQVFRRWQGLD